MNQELLDRIAKLIFPYLKTKHKDKESYEIAKKILQEINDQSLKNQ
jgi:hypothetical protein